MWSCCPCTTCDSTVCAVNICKRLTCLLQAHSRLQLKKRPFQPKYTSCRGAKWKHDWLRLGEDPKGCKFSKAPSRPLFARPFSLQTPRTEAGYKNNRGQEQEKSAAHQFQGKMPASDIIAKISARITTYPEAHQPRYWDWILKKTVNGELTWINVKCI